MVGFDRLAASRSSKSLLWVLHPPDASTGTALAFGSTSYQGRATPLV
ncbi:hypothetical protein ANO14919_052920 [Xylariales sp. No.14919]|nr:hypothetical protein ANO14919_052920 [Xylariales sp. No.14919]